MSSPALLLVDDSQAILAFEEAVLGGHYTVTKAMGGREGLRLARELRPAAILLDLSMPEMDGEQVLAALKADSQTSEIPVIVVSNEHARADSCLKGGAVDFVPKPIRQETLRAVVERVLEQSKVNAESNNVGVLFVEAASVLLGLKLDIVRAAALQPQTRPIRTECSFVDEMIEFRGVALAVLDIAKWLGRAHSVPVIDRKLVVVRTSPPLALCVDDVREPELVPAANIARGDAILSAPHPVSDVAVAMVRALNGADEAALIEPAAALPPHLREGLPCILAAASERGGPPSSPMARLRS